MLPQLTQYVVTLSFQFPAWDEKSGIPFNVWADSKAEAIKRAREQARYDGHLCGGKGRASFKAVKIEAQETTRSDQS